MRETRHLLAPVALLALSFVLEAQAPDATSGKKNDAPSAAVSVGLAAEGNEIVAPNTSFTFGDDTKIYIGARVTGAAGNYTLSYRKGDATVLAKRIPVPATPYRIWTWKTFRQGDAGDWTAVLTGPGGAAASTDFKVAFK